MKKCLRVLKERIKSRFDNYSVMNSELIIPYITFRDCAHFSDNLSRNSCMSQRLTLVSQICHALLIYCIVLYFRCISVRVRVQFYFERAHYLFIYLIDVYI